MLSWTTNASVGLRQSLTFIKTTLRALRLTLRIVGEAKDFLRILVIISYHLKAGKTNNDVLLIYFILHLRILIINSKRLLPA